MRALTCYREAPKVHNVRQPYENRQARHGEGGKEHHVAIRPRFQLRLVGLHPLERARAAAEHAAPPAHLAIALLRTHRLQRGGLGLVVLEGLKGGQGELGLVVVGARNVLHDANGLFVLALVDEELGALAKVEEEEAQAKHGERDGPQREEQVAPALVVVAPAAGLPRGESGRIARGERVGLGEVGAARHGGDEAEGDGGAEDHADGLEDGQGREQEALVLGQELEGDGRVDGDVAAHAEADKGREDQEGGVVVGGAQTEAENGGKETCQVECPFTTWVPRQELCSLLRYHVHSETSSKWTRGGQDNSIDNVPTMSLRTPHTKAPAVKPALKQVDMLPL